MYMSWEEFVDYSGTDQGKEACIEVDKNLVEPEHRQFKLHAVGATQSAGWALGRHFQILGETEFETYMGSKAHSKMPSVPSIVARKEGSTEDETIYLLSHPLLPHRTLSIFLAIRLMTVASTFLQSSISSRR